MATLYPIFLDLENRPVLVVGGGTVALRKVVGLIETGARITVVSPAFEAELESMPITRVAHGYEPAHMTLADWVLAFAATSDAKVNDMVAGDARARGILCCRVDAPEDGDFVNGAMGAAGGIRVAVSTGKASPVIAARVRNGMLQGIDPVLVAWTRLMEGWRTTVLTRVADPGRRRTLLKRLAGEQMEKVLRQEGDAGAQRVFENWVREASGK